MDDVYLNIPLRRDMGDGESMRTETSRAEQRRVTINLRDERRRALIDRCPNREDEPYGIHARRGAWRPRSCSINGSFDEKSFRRLKLRSTGHPL